MDFMNPAAAQESSQIVNIICEEKVRHSFVSHLSAALRREGISVLMMVAISEEGIIDHSYANQKTNSFSDDHNQAVYVLVISNAMKSLLRESCHKKIPQLIYPLLRRRNDVDVLDSMLYVVDPLTRLSGWFDGRLEPRIMQTVHQSRNSSKTILTDSEQVEEIVKDVYGKFYSGERVGIYSKLLEIESLLYKQPRDVRGIGLWGMPGVGKTTLAKAVFSHMSEDYDASFFIENFDTTFHKDGLHRLLQQQFGEIIKQDFGLKSRYIMRPSLRSDKRILLVLDDVCDSMAAASFLGWLDWFGPGSLVIMTSTDKQVFAFCQIYQIYEVQGLNEHEALQLLSYLAFGKDMPKQNETELSMKLIDYANGNPLALNIYGRELKRNMPEMETAFLELKQCPPQEIQDVLKNVFSTLDDNEKNIVLNIAFFFKGENINYVVQLLEGCRYFPRVGIDVLVDKCLVTISENTVQMSSLIQDICQKFFSGETESCTRMWEPYIIKYLLEDDELKTSGESSAMPVCDLVIEDIESIFLDTLNLKFDVKHDAFKNMFNLRFLKIYNPCSEYVHGLNFPKGLDYLPCGLRFLHWENYPLKSVPQDFNLEKLVELCMPYSQLQTFGAGTKNLKMLKRIRLCHSQQLVEFDLPLNAQNIELIDLQGCTKLQSFPDTSKLQHLLVVNLSGCTEIKSFQGAPPNIEELNLQGTSMREIPISVVTHFPQKAKLDRKKLLNLLENFQDVEYIDLESVTNLAKATSSYNQSFGKLVHLNMKDCSHLQSIPGMVHLESLQVLHLSGCSELKEIKGFPRNMRKLYLGGTSIREVPQLPKSLEFLNAHGCKHLKSIGLDFEQLPRHYTFSNCFNFSSQVIAEFLEFGPTRVASLARAHQQQEVIKAPEVSICIPADARLRSLFLLREGPSEIIDLAPWTQKPLSGFAMSVLVSFEDDYHNVVGLGIRCVCTLKTKNDQPDRITERFYQCWIPTEAPKVEWDHIFVFYDTKILPSAVEENDPNMSVKFDFQTVSWENKIFGANCRVTECGVQVITAPTDDTSICGVRREIETETETLTSIEEHPPTSSREPETKSLSLSSTDPHKVSKLRSKGTMFWKWASRLPLVRTIRRDTKKTLRDLNNMSANEENA